MMPTSFLSAFLQAFGSKPSDGKASVISNRGATKTGFMQMLAKGAKMSAEPKPEKPRAKPATKALTVTVKIENAVNLPIPRSDTKESVTL
jgi:hypothetical protein